jgi:hypothetical protein
VSASSTIKRSASELRAQCPTCDTGFTHKATKPQRYCSPKCRDTASNARRAPTGNRPGRPSSRPQDGLKALGVITAHLNSDVAPTAPQDPSCEPSRHRIGDRVCIWVDDAAIGAGERHLMVTEIGKVHVKLYSFAALTEVTVTRRDFEEHAQAYGSNPVTVLGILERNLKSYERARLDHDKPTARAVEALRKEAEGVLP